MTTFEAGGEDKVNGMTCETSKFDEQPAVQALCPNPECGSFGLAIGILIGRNIKAWVQCPGCRVKVYVRAIVYPPGGPDDGADSALPAEGDEAGRESMSNIDHRDEIHVVIDSPGHYRLMLLDETDGVKVLDQFFLRIDEGDAPLGHLWRRSEFDPVGDRALTVRVRLLEETTDA